MATIKIPLFQTAKQVFPPMAPQPLLEVECADAGLVSDGYHTFNELYEHRHLLYLSLLKVGGFKGWRSRRHSDGASYEGWFLVGATVPGVQAQISYHLPDRLWDHCPWLETHEIAPVPWDGHSSQDVLERLARFLEAGG